MKHFLARLKAMVAAYETRKSRQSFMSRLLKTAVIAGGLGASGSVSTAQVLPIGVGDKVSVVVTGLPSFDFTAEVIGEGTINLTWLGDFQAAGLTEEALEANIQAAAEGRIVKQYDRDGTLFLIQLEGSDVNIFRSAYKPVIVAGAVMSPGEVEFTPNMTVREALALAGGIDDRLLPDDVDIDPIQVTRWQSDFSMAAIEHAEAIALNSRIDAELAKAPVASFASNDVSNVSQEVLDELEASQRRILQENLEADAANEAFYVRFIEQVEKRIENLRQQQITMASALASEEAEEARVLDLVSRGLAAQAQAADVRRSTMLTATRLLDVEDDLARTEIDLTRANRQLVEYREGRVAALLSEQVGAQERARTARARMRVSSQFLALIGSSIVTDGTVSEFGVTSALFRRSDDRATPVSVDMDTFLMPGDTIEFEFEEIVPVPLTE